MLFNILIIFLVLFNILSIGFPIILDLIIFGVFLCFIKKHKLIIFNTNVIFLILLFGTSKFSINTEDNKNYYRGHEKFYKNKLSYQINVNEYVDIPFGDLVAVDICLNDKEINELKVVRKQKFVTDKYGFRNSKIDLVDSNLILVGDSQVSGSGLTDELLISSQINQITNFKTTNLSIGGANPSDYEKILKRNFSKIKSNAKILIFYFEGNDFTIKKKDAILKDDFNQNNDFKIFIKSGYQRLERNKDKFFKKIINFNNFLYKKIRPISQRYYFKVLAKWSNSCPVKYDRIGKDLIGFFWFDKQNKIEYETYAINDPKILEKIHKVYFIPTKLNVYKNFVKNVKFHKNDKFRILKELYAKKNIEVVDLTNILRDEVDNYLYKNKYLYFKDDTHLNGNGAFVIANFIKKDL